MSGVPYQQLFDLTREWLDLADQEVNLAAADAYRHCVAQLVALTGPPLAGPT